MGTITTTAPTIEVGKELNLNIDKDKIKNQIRQALDNNNAQEALRLSKLLETLKVEYSPTTEGVRAFLGSAAFEFGDEIEAAARTLFSNGTFNKEDYYKIRDDLRAKQKQFAEDNPKLSTGLKIGGGFIVPGGFATQATKAALLKNLGLGTTYGAASGAGANEKPSELVGDIFSGGALGAGGTGLFHLGGRFLSPKLKPGVKELQEQGARVTPGQAFGGTTQTIEEGVSNLPFAGSFVKGTQRDKIKSMNYSAINKALEPLGFKVKPSQTVKEMVKEGQTLFDKSYDKLLNKVTLEFDDVFNTKGIELLERAQKDLSKQNYDKFAKIFSKTENSLRKKTTGQTLKSVEQELKNKLTTYKSSAIADDQFVADYTEDLLDLFLDNLVKQNPKFRQELIKNNTAYKNWVRIETASKSIKGKDGAFTAEALLNATKRGGPGASRKTVARGDAPMQDFADIAYDIYGKNMPDSGTAPRLTTLGTLLGSGAYGLDLSGTTLLGLGAASAPYTQGGSRLFDYLIGSKNIPFISQKATENIGDAIAQYAPLISSPGLLEQEKSFFQ